jgi:hypothetical protein
MSKPSANLRKKLEERRKQLASKGGKNSYFTLKDEGTFRYRPLPVPGEEEFGVEAITFYFNSINRYLISPMTFGEPCAVYEFSQKLKNSQNEADQALMKEFRQRKVYFVPHIKYKDIKGKEIDDEAGARLLSMPSSLFQHLIDLYLDDEQGDFTDPKLGYDIKYTRTGKKLDTEYSIVPCRPTPLDKKYAKNVYDPKAMLKDIIPSYEETKKILDEFISGGSDADDEDESFKKKKKSSSSDSGVKKKKAKKGDI